MLGMVKRLQRGAFLFVIHLPLCPFELPHFIENGSDKESERPRNRPPRKRENFPVRRNRRPSEGEPAVGKEGVNSARNLEYLVEKILHVQIPRLKDRLLQY